MRLYDWREKWLDWKKSFPEWFEAALPELPKLSEGGLLSLEQVPEPCDLRRTEFVGQVFCPVSCMTAVELIKIFLDQRRLQLGRTVFPEIGKFLYRIGMNSHYFTS